MQTDGSEGALRFQVSILYRKTSVEFPPRCIKCQTGHVHRGGEPVSKAKSGEQLERASCGPESDVAPTHRRQPERVAPVAGLKRHGPASRSQGAVSVAGA